MMEVEVEVESAVEKPGKQKRTVEEWIRYCLLD